MSVSIIPKETTIKAANNPNWLQKTARKIVHGQLAKYKTARLHVTDPMGSETFGSDDSNAFTAHLQVNDLQFYPRVMLGGDLAFSETFIDGSWTTPDLTQLFRFFVKQIDVANHERFMWFKRQSAKIFHKLQDNTLAGSKRNIQAHYDLGNDFFKLFLDESLTYSSGIFYSETDSMLDASTNKLDRLCKKLKLTEDDHLLEIGTGWGSMAIHAASNYGCKVTTTTLSNEQFDLANERVKAKGLEDKITVLKQDYRLLEGKFDKIVSIEMIEAVGHNHLPEYFKSCQRLLKDDGVFALQSINMNEQQYDAYLGRVDFIQRYVFPGSCCPAQSAIHEAVKKHTDFRICHTEEIGTHYARTLKTWHDTFNTKLDEVRDMGYSDAFIRLWQYYLCYCEAGFAERYIGTTQMILTRPQATLSAPLPDLGA